MVVVNSRRKVAPRWRVCSMHVFIFLQAGTAARPAAAGFYAYAVYGEAMVCERADRKVLHFVREYASLLFLRQFSFFSGDFTILHYYNMTAKFILH